MNVFEAYLSDMSQYALLSADEEVALAEQYRRALAAKVRLTEDRCPDSRERERLLVAVADGERARERVRQAKSARHAAAALRRRPGSDV